MIRRLLAGWVLVTALVLLVLGVPLGAVFARAERDRLLARIGRDATTVALFAQQPLQRGEDAMLRGVADDYRRHHPGQLLIGGPDGELRAGSPGSLAEGSPWRRELAAALDGRPQQGVHRLPGGGAEFFAAVPVNSGGRVFGAVVVTHPASSVERRVHHTWLVLTESALATLLAVAFLSWILARSVTAPLRRIGRAAAELGDGALDARAPVPSGPPELRQLAEVFNQTAGKLQHLLEAQRAFVADASHQLRTPLAALRVRLEIAERSAGPDARDDMDAAAAELDRLSRLVDGLLALAAADHARSAPQPLDVGEIVASRCDIWSPYADEAGVRVAASGSAVADVTPGCLEQVLDNLIANALDVSPPGGTVTVTAGRAGPWVDVHVVDEGPGMDAQRRTLAFTRLWRSPDGRRTIGGAGLGLAIVKQLVDNDGGTVALEEAPGGGIDAHVRLRAARYSAAQFHPHRPDIGDDLYQVLDQPI